MRLYDELDRSAGTLDKVAALKRYFDAADPADAAWAVAVLSGRKLVRGVSSTRLRQWASEATSYPAWLIDVCYSHVGDLSETLALVTRGGGTASDPSLHQVIERYVLPLPGLDESGQRAIVTEVWSRFDQRQRFLYHKLISGTFRVGVAKKLLVRALAEHAGVEAAEMAHRLSGRWKPTPENFQRLLSGDAAADAAHRPYPFYLAYALDVAPKALGPVADWQLEWKWDGIRAQLIRRAGEVALWSRGEELVTDAFPEIVAAARELPEDVVLDGEILAWEGDRPLPFYDLQHRLNRKHVELRLFPEVPVTFMAYDLLEHAGRDLRAWSTAQRRSALQQVGVAEDPPLQLSPLVPAAAWSDAEAAVAAARDHGVEGIMLKRQDAPYGVGRQRGAWWKWKADPFSIDGVLIQAQQGTGRRAGLLTSYTFGVWDRGELVPVTKAYTGLTNDEIEQVDRFIRNHTVGRHGPVRVVEPELVFEIHFEAIAPSPRHRSGIALRFPRMARWRRDKTPAEADHLAALLRLLPERSVQRPSIR